MTSTIQIDWKMIKECQRIIKELEEMGVKVGKSYDLLLPFEKPMRDEYDLCG